MKPLNPILGSGINQRGLEAYEAHKRKLAEPGGEEAHAAHMRKLSEERQAAIRRKQVEKATASGKETPANLELMARPPPQAGVPLPSGPSSYVPEGEVSTNSLRVAFKEAINHHLSLHGKDRIENSKRAKEALGDHLTRTNKGKVKDLLNSNGKLEKTQKGYKGGTPLQILSKDGKERGVEAWGLALSPAYQEGKMNICPNRFACQHLCLGLTSGQMHAGGGGKDLTALKGPRLVGRRRTLAMFRNPKDFAIKLHDEILSHKMLADKHGNHLGMRLNVLSDIAPAVHEPIIKAHKDVSFYDYTKLDHEPVAENHHLTRSSTGISQVVNGEHIHNPHQNWHSRRDYLDKGQNVAMAFSDKKHLPTHVLDQETGKRYEVINGDEHDFRPIDPKAPDGKTGVIVGLRNKMVTGKANDAAKTHNGFFVHYEPKVLRHPNGKLIREPSPGINKKGKPIPGASIPTVHHVVIPTQEKAAPLYDNEGNVIPRAVPTGYSPTIVGAEPGYEKQLRARMKERG